MAEVTGASQPPDSNAADQGKNQRTSSAAHGPQRRNNRNRRNQPQFLPQVDGTVSDNVTNPTASPRSKKQTKPKQSVAPIIHEQNASMGNANGQKPRPVSMGGPLLPATPAKEQAYAGPTFHASPAPSSLPVPKFFSKSVPNVAGQPSLQSRLDSEKAEVKKEESSPESDVVAPVSRDALHSPLDLFFLADKAEKQKTRSGSDLLSPQKAARQSLATGPRNPFQHSGRSVFLKELDGDSEEMPSPKTVPPGSRPPLNDRARSSPGTVPQSPKEEQDREAYTRSLKDLLFNNVNGTAQNTTPPQQPHAPLGAQAPSTPSPFNRPVSGSGALAPSSEQQQQQNHYALHYGNRNLSPLFKAARETPMRSSGLRQELQNGRPTPPDLQQPPQQQAQHSDANSFSRDYLNQHIRSNHTGSLPQLSSVHGINADGFSNSMSGPSASPDVKHGVQAVGPVGDASPRTSGNKDIRSMEDDLRRMLKLNVLG
ncbi:hypothetical protein B0A50_03406 [Salinomyces thailandicus]|uniref:Proteophosphoglycan 5 n=1 Tax=Salinomyces thailandicus TaxID=706561 RepID=A0A4U0U2K5_9PEZI|nr:hypothetical protein B0A50_03406 [Salinomyces thailandica]